MNLKLLIVDDEYEILTWLEEMFRYDFEPAVEVYTADSAGEALELLNKISFDVVLTDIKMPGMDGLTLFSHIKANWPRCKTVFLTGYPNFDDMYKIIRHKDVRYILKSEDDEVITRTVREVLDEQKAEFEQEVLRQKQSQDIEKARELIRQDFMANILRGVADAPSAAGKTGMNVDIEKPLLMFTLRIDGGFRAVNAGADNSLLLEAAGNVVFSSLPESLKTDMCIVDGKWYAGMIQYNVPGGDFARLYAVTASAVEYGQALFEQLHGAGFSAAVESTPVTYREIPAMFGDMRRILQGRLGTEKAVIAHMEMLDGDGGQEETNHAGEMSLLHSHLEMRRRRDFFAVFDRTCQEMLKCSSLKDIYGLRLYYSTGMMLMQFISENQLERRFEKGPDLYKLTQAEVHLSWREATQYLYEVAASVFDALSVPDNDLSERALRRICEYIDNNLEKDLSLTRLADIGGFNASYLSRLFKQNYNITISDYVTDKRMKLAARLLRTTNDKIQDIAEKTGYMSSQSFARVFRSYFSVSALEYRDAGRSIK